MSPRLRITSAGLVPIDRPPAKGSTRAWRRRRAAVLERDGYRCRYCGRYADTVDHVLPRALGGPDDESNLVAACGPCNRAKGARHPQGGVSSNRARGPGHLPSSLDGCTGPRF